MKNDLLSEIVESTKKLRKLASPWRAKAWVSAKTRVQLKKGPNGHIRDSFEVVDILEINIFQSEKDEWVIPMPHIPAIKLYQPTASSLRFFVVSAAELLKGNPPSEKRWEIESNRYIEEMIAENNNK